MTTAAAEIQWTSEQRGQDKWGFYPISYVGRCPNGGTIHVYRSGAEWFAEYVSPGMQHIRHPHPDGCATWHESVAMAEDWYRENH